jgi:DNA-binding CsgD family transcriptional regulator
MKANPAPKHRSSGFPRRYDFSRSPAAGGKRRHPFQLCRRSAILRIKCLTPRQHKVLYLLAQGLTYKQIAIELKVTYATVTSHVYSALRRAQVATTEQAIALLARAEL